MRSRWQIWLEGGETDGSGTKACDEWLRRMAGSGELAGRATVPMAELTTHTVESLSETTLNGDRERSYLTSPIVTQREMCGLTSPEPYSLGTS